MKIEKYWSALAILFFTFHFSLFTFVSCDITPPLYLPQEDVLLELPITITDLKTVWNIDVDWKTQWWYGWDEEDIERWGELDYPTPTYFEVRRFYQGETQSDEHKLEEAFTIYQNTFRRRYSYGFHDLLVWSNIDSKDGTQVVTIDETDADNIIASTTQTKTSYSGNRAPSTKAIPLKNQPEVFYTGYERNFDIPRNNFGEGWRYDEVEQVWVKELTMTLDPLVYIYLVQVVIYNNNGKIKGLSDNPTMTNMANTVNINTGWTSDDEVDVVFEMNMKNNLPAAQGRMADIIGGRFTTFGLCDMPPWFNSRTDPYYSGSRGELVNNVLLDIAFSNTTEKVFSYNVTEQMQRQTHGGIITIEIDADTITIPPIDYGSGSGFDPWVEEQDSITHEFGI